MYQFSTCSPIGLECRQPHGQSLSCELGLRGVAKSCLLHGKDEDQFLCGAVREVGQHVKAVSKFPGKGGDLDGWTQPPA